MCQAQAFLSSAGISTGAFVAILLCVVILLAILMLFSQPHHKKTNKDKLILSEEDIRENVVTYDDEGGGEEDTEAFDITELRNPKASECYPKLHWYYDPHEAEETEEDSEDGTVIVQLRKRQNFDCDTYNPESEPSWFVVDHAPRNISQSAPCLLLDGHDIVQKILHQKVTRADCDTRGPPYDSLQTFAYEGRGSLAGSVSSLGLTLASIPELSFSDLEDWEADHQVLKWIIGEQDTTDS